MESKDNNIQDKINQDAFSESIRAKMVNHTMKVDAAVWKSVSKTLPAKSRRMPVWLFYSLSAAASLALVMTVAFQFFANREPNHEAVTAKVQKMEQLSDQKQESAKTVTSVIPKDKTLVAANKNQASEVFMVDADTAASNQPVKVQPTETVLQPEQAFAENTTQSVLKEKEKIEWIDEQALGKVLQEQEKDWTDQMNKHEKKSLQFAAGIGSGAGGASASFLGNSMDFMAAELAPVKVKAVNIMKAEDFRNRDYLPPVSVGARISYPLNDQWSVETGLTYTWLMTRLNESYWGNYQASLSLHYLGIPLNIRTVLLHAGKWNVYAGTGFMLEKGLWSDYQQFQDWGTAEYRTTASQKIDGFQWSAQASIGMEYQISKQFKFYFEPGVTYFFENEQPFSIRTEMPLCFVLNTGIRFKI